MSVALVGSPPPVDILVRDAAGDVVERPHIRWAVDIGRGVVWTRGLRVGDRVECNGHVVVVATPETVGRR